MGDTTALPGQVGSGLVAAVSTVTPALQYQHLLDLAQDEIKKSKELDITRSIRYRLVEIDNYNKEIDNYNKEIASFNAHKSRLQGEIKELVTMGEFQEKDNLNYISKPSYTVSASGCMVSTGGKEGAIMSS